jgi:acyl dehydratase
VAVVELDSLPSLTALYGKAVASAGRSALGRLPGFGGGSDALPDTELLLSEVEIDRHNLAAYDRVCGFTLRDELPPTYPHIVAFPLAMKVMTSADFPFAVIGLVHIANRIEQLRPIRADEKLRMRVWTAGLEPHDRGTQFQIHAEASSGDEVVWLSRNTYLHKEGGGGLSSPKDRGDHPQPPEPKAVWKLPGDTGRRYASVSGDRNPIHLRRMTAVPFGMPRPIAHGMWLKARCLAALEGELPGSLVAEVSFKLPVPLPGKVSFADSLEHGGISFSLHDGRNERPHLTGTVAPR